MTRGGFELRAVLALCLPVHFHRVLALILRCTKSELLCCAVLRCAALCLRCACAVLCCHGACDVTGCCHRVLALILRCTNSELLCCAVLRCACALLALFLR